MKKLIYCATALVAALFAASCQREMHEPVAEGGVTYTITLPEAVQTKGNGGYQDYSLHYEVYKTIDAAELPTASRLFEKSVDFTGNTATVSLDLLNDQDYTVLFWANKKDVTATYFDLTDLRNVQLNTGSLNANDNDRDAFCGMDQIDNHDGSVSKTVKLTRPFAQVNIGTIVPTVAQIGYDVTPQESYVKISGVPVAYNVLQGKAVAGTSDVEFKQSAIPKDKKIGTDYTLVAMNYVLVPESNITVEYRIKTPNGDVNNIVSNVPVKKNYRTNIIGNLLTSNATYTVELKPGFEEGSIYGPEFVKEPKYNADTKTYTVVEALELKWVAQQVNSGKKSFKGETVQLAADIDLKNEPWTPIGTSWQNAFKGTFEGVAITRSESTYPTISNVNIVGEKNLGFFGVAIEGAIKNFNINNVKVAGKDYVGAVVGRTTSPVSNVHVNNAELTALAYLMADGVTYDGGAKVGGIAGILDDSTAPHMIGNSVTNATIRGYRDLGGIVGSLSSQPCTIKNCKVEDLTFIVTSCYTPYEDNKASGSYGPILGGTRSFPGDVIEGNEGTDINDHKVLIEETEGGVYDSEEKVYTVTTPAGLAAALQGSGAAGAGNHTIQINGDLDMTGMDWTPIVVDGYNGADIVTVEGNDKTIKGLDGALFAGGFAGGSGIVIKNLTIEDAHMIADNTQGYGAFVNCADSMDEITLINCHLKNSTIITPNDGAAESRIGGLVGWTAGYNNQNDGPVDSYITIQNCSVTGCTLKGAGSIGGICGHAGANAATFTTIENCTVTDNTLISTDNGGWRVGTVVGTANNGQCVIKNITSSGNTISQTDKTAPFWHTDLYGRFVPNGTGSLTIDGVAMTDVEPKLVDGYTALFTDKDGVYCIFDKAGLADFRSFLAANTGRHPYDRTYKVMNDIDAEGYVWNSVLVIPDAGNAKGLVLDGNGKTISNLTVAGEGMFNAASAGSVIKNITMDNVTNNSESHNAAIFWGSVYSSVSFDNVHIKNSAVNGLCNAGAFVGGTYEPNNLVVTFKNCSVENSAVKAVGYEWQDPTGASGFLGKAFASSKVVFEGTNSIDNATTITNENGLVGGRVYAYTTHIDGNWEGTGVCDTFTNWDGVSIAAKVGTTTYPTIEAAIEVAKAGQTVKLVDDVTVSDLTLPAGIIFNGNGKQINGTIVAGGDLTFAGHTKVTSFSASYYNRTITIGEGACLEVTGTDRVSLAYGNTFDIIGDVTDAKTADKTDIQPSLIIPGGISITGGNNAVMSIKDAYVQIGSTTSKNNSANGTFTLNIKNSIVDFTDQFTLSEPKNGMNPTFKVNVENSVLTTVKKFCIAAKNSTIEVDNSSITTSNNVRNSGTINLKNGSLLSGNTIQFGENGGNDGIINVDASTLTINAGNAPSAFDGKGEGVINATNSATVSVTYYKDMTIKTDATSTFTGTEVQ